MQSIFCFYFTIPVNFADTVSISYTVQAYRTDIKFLSHYDVIITNVRT